MLKPPRLRAPAPNASMSPPRKLGIASPRQAGIGGMEKARFDTRGKFAHVLYAVLIFVVGALIAGATGKFGAVVFLLCLDLAGYLLYRRFTLGRTIYDPWP